MKKNKKAETIIWVFVSVIILSWILLWIIWIVWLQENNNIYFEDEFKKRILEKNIENIVKNMNLNQINTNQNSWYFYINNDWNNISLSQDEVYKQKDFLLKNINTDIREKYEIKIKALEVIEWIKTISEINIKRI